MIGFDRGFSKTKKTQFLKPLQPGEELHMTYTKKTDIRANKEIRHEIHKEKRNWGK